MWFFKFLTDNILWTAPIIALLLSLLIKVTSKPDRIEFKAVDYLDFGFDLSFTTMFILLADGEHYSIVYITWFAILVLISLFVRKRGWNNDDKKKLVGVIIPDVFGALSLVFAILFTNGGKA